MILLSSVKPARELARAPAGLRILRISGTALNNIKQDIVECRNGPRNRNLLCAYKAFLALDNNEFSGVHIDLYGHFEYRFLRWSRDLVLIGVVSILVRYGHLFRIKVFTIFFCKRILYHSRNIPNLHVDLYNLCKSILDLDGLREGPVSLS